jgi:hypothetical protein
LIPLLEAFVFLGQAELQLIFCIALRSQHHENYNLKGGMHENAGSEGSDPEIGGQ